MRLVHVHDSDDRQFQQKLTDVVEQCDAAGDRIASVEHAIAAVPSSPDYGERTFYSAIIAIVPKPTLKPPREPGPGERAFNELTGGKP